MNKFSIERFGSHEQFFDRIENDKQVNSCCLIHLTNDKKEALTLVQCPLNFNEMIFFGQI